MSEPAYTYEWGNGAGETLLRFGRRSTSVSGWPESNMFAQPELERLLDARARGLPSVEVHRGCEVVAIRTTGDGVAVTVVAAAGEHREEWARYVVGCDGANSFVRERLGVTITDLGFVSDWLVVDVIPHRVAPLQSSILKWRNSSTP